jgi:DNA-binding NtrC family response regulator
MPGLSGLELLGHVRQKFPNTPVIIISGISDQEHAQGLIRLGAFDFLLKPFSLDSVEKSVKRAVEYRRRLLAGEEFMADRNEVKDTQSEVNDWKIVKE